MTDNSVFKFNSNSKISILTLDLCSQKPPYVHFKRKPTFYILYYISEGEMFLREGDTDYHLVENDMILLDMDHTHVGYKTGTVKFYYFHFLMDFGDENGSIIMPKYIHLSQTQQILDARNIVGRMVRVWKEQRNYYEQMTEGLLMQLLLIAASTYAGDENIGKLENKNKASLRIPELIYYLNLNYSKDITGEALENEFSYNFDYLNRQFKLQTGQTIFNYLNTIRIEQSKSMISTGLYQLSDIAAACGFSDVYYFTRVFKKYTGTTPGKYHK